MRKNHYAVYFKHGFEAVEANNKLDALMIAMLRRVDMKDQFAKFILDEFGQKFAVDNGVLLSAIAIYPK